MNNDLKTNFGNSTDDESMPELIDSDTDFPTTQQPTSEVQTTVVPTVVANMEASVDIESSDVEVE